jgi:peptide-methionine (S)-S-oxide reductase
MRLLMIACAAMTAMVFFSSKSSAAGSGKPPIASQTAKATFAGGCFWCLEPPYEGLDGIVSVTVGYAGGTKKNPTYEEVSSGSTGHAESIEIVYNPSKISYAKLLDIFWRNIDPTVKDRQFCDVGAQYRSAIFYHDEEQKKLAEQTKGEIEVSKRVQGPIYTEILPAGTFYPAEDYHQKYYKKNPVRYKYYRWNCGRDQRLKELWGESTPEHE